MENIENNMSELDDLKTQYATLKDQFDQQQIVNSNLMKSAIRTKTKFFRRYRKEIIFVYPAITLFVCWFLWHSLGAVALWPCIATALFMAACTFIELRITRHVGDSKVENKDLLTLSRDAAQASKSFLIYIITFLALLMVLFVFITWVIWKNTAGVLTDNLIPRVLLAMLIAAVYVAICCVKFVKEGNGVMKQVAEISPECGDPRVERNAELFKTAGILLGAFYAVALGVNMFHVINGMAGVSLFVLLVCIIYCNILLVFLCRHGKQSRLLSVCECLAAVFALLAIHWLTHQYLGGILLALIAAGLLALSAVTFFITRKKR